MVYRHSCKLISLLAVTLTMLGAVPAHALPKIGQSLPAFSATTNAGQQVSNQSYRGQVLLLVFSTDFCSACKQAAPGIGKFAGRYGKQGFHVLGLFSGFGFENDDLQEYMKTYAVTYPMALFEQRVAENQFGVRSVPYSLLVDRKGMVAGVFYGFSDRTMKQMEDQVKKLLTE